MMRGENPEIEASEIEKEVSKPIEIPVRDNVNLKQITVQDSQALFELIDKNRENLSQYNDDTAAKYPSLESVETRNATQSQDEQRFGIWDNGVLVGFVKVTKRGQEKAEIGYWLGSEFTGKGYMTDATKALTEFSLKNLGYNELIATVNKENKASHRVLERAGYKVVGENPEKPTDLLLKYFEGEI